MIQMDIGNPQPIAKAEILGRLPPLWPDETLLGRIAQHLAESNHCVVALDDDPTGTQTVHNIWVVTRWNVDHLSSVLADGEPALYILTNSRSMPLAEAQRINREIAVNLVAAAKATRRSISVVSRSDSTLRGHYPEEVDALAQALGHAQATSFDGVCIIPFFQEGGRFTINDVHWVQEGALLIPAAQTAYARDPVFGYHHSYLPAWVEEKTSGRIPASLVLSISLDTLRKRGPLGVANQLREVTGGQVVIVNAADYRDLEVFVAGLHAAEADGKRFLFRTAASFVRVAAGLRSRPLLTAIELDEANRHGGGLLVFGSHVPKSTAQLRAIQALGSVESVELPVSGVLMESTRQQAIVRAAAKLNTALAAGRTGLLYTSRELVTGRDQMESLMISRRVSAALMDVLRRLEYRPRYVVGKGGITCSDLATEGMGVAAARVLGQVLPGVPAWKLGPESRWPGMPFVVFPGNVGDENSVAEIVRMLEP